MNGFVDKIIELLRTTSLNEIYSPFLIQDAQNIAAVQLRPGGNSQEGLSNVELYQTVNFNILVRNISEREKPMGGVEPNKEDAPYGRVNIRQLIP